MSMKPLAAPCLPVRVRQKAIAVSIASCMLALSVLPAPTAFAQQARSNPARFRGDAVTLNFVNADIEGVARAMSVILKQQFVVDPRVRGNITLYSEQPLAPRDAYLSFLAALRGLGFAVAEVGGLLKIVPEADAKLQTGTVSVGEVSRRGDQVMTQIFKLSYENANNLVPVLRPLISPNNTINANPGNNSLVITDYADNLQRIGKIIASMDTPSGGDVEVIKIEHSAAADIAPMVQRLADTGVTGAPGVTAVPGAAGGSASVIVDQRSNSLIVKTSNPARMSTVRALVAKLDQPMQGSGAAHGNVWVVYLKNADAVKLATVLRAAYSGSGGGAGGGGAGGLSASTNPSQTAGQLASGAAPGSTGASPQTTTPLNSAAAPSTGGFVQADPASNSLIITAPEPMYRQLRAVIDQLDSRRAQVYVESLIVEVDPSQTVDFGIQWQALGNPNSSYIGGAGTNFGSNGNILSSQGKATAIETLAGLGTGGNIGIVRNFGGANGFGLAAIARALSTQADTNILSTPNLVTLDNEEARIVVGQNVPFITGQFTNTGTSLTSPFQTIERKDVGITLRIKPQIGENGTVRMTIYQESSSVATSTAVGTDNAGPTTNKRSIESTIVVDDGSIMVLGGLIEDKFDITRAKVPVLGDIPYLGALFRSENRSRKKTNLMVFLRPVVMRDQAASDRISLDRYDYIRGQQQASQPPPSAILRINESPVLPPIRPEDTGPSGAPRPLGDTSPPPPVVVPSHPASAPSS
jgi:general secretion pathway protein D